MNMQTVGQATPVLLLQTTTPDNSPRRADFSSDKEYIRFLKKELKKKDSKPEEKKKEDDKKKSKTFTVLEMFSILSIASFPVAMTQIAIGYAVFRVLRAIATGQ
jgi:hypothetical protein